MVSLSIYSPFHLQAKVERKSRAHYIPAHLHFIFTSLVLRPTGNMVICPDNFFFHLFSASDYSGDTRSIH